MKTIRVNTSRPYDVHIGRNILQQVGSHITALPGQRYEKVAVITDDVVQALYAGAVTDSLHSQGFQTCVFSFPNGEASKDMNTVMDMIQFLTQQGITRTDLILALGGGVVGDMAGFAASIYQRGIDYMQVPTTLLAAVDSSVGGKTAVNIPAGKNLVGAFWQPVLVVCDADTLNTLPEDTFRDGMAEVIKYGCIWDADLFQDLLHKDMQTILPEILARCVEIKAEVVVSDEREQGLRKILNFGHTAAHGIEKLSGYAISHGKAVAAGMAIVCAVGEAQGITAAGTRQQLELLLRRFQLPTTCDYTASQLAQACQSDKKRSGGTITFVLLEEIGKTKLTPVQAEHTEAFLSSGKECMA